MLWEGSADLHALLRKLVSSRAQSLALQHESDEADSKFTKREIRIPRIASLRIAISQTFSHDSEQTVL